VPLDGCEFDTCTSICLVIRVVGRGFMGRDATGFISTDEPESSSDEDESLCEEVKDTSGESGPEEDVLLSVELSLVVLLLCFVSKTPSPRFCQHCEQSCKDPRDVKGKTSHLDVQFFVVLDVLNVHLVPTFLGENFIGCMNGREKGLDASEDCRQLKFTPSGSRHVRSVGGATGCVLRSELFRMSCGLVDTFVLDEVSFNLSRSDPSEEVRGMGGECRAVTNAVCSVAGPRLQYRARLALIVT